MITRSAFTNYLDKCGIDWWYTKLDFGCLVTGPDAVTVKLEPKYGDYCSRMMTVSRFERIDNRVFVKYNGELVLWNADELINFVKERGHRL